MTISLELLAILFLGTVNVYLLLALKKATKTAQYYALAFETIKHGLHTTYKTLDKVLSSAKDDYPEAVGAINSDFSNRMDENLAEWEKQTNE